MSMWTVQVATYPASSAFYRKRQDFCRDMNPAFVCILKLLQLVSFFCIISINLLVCFICLLCAWFHCITLLLTI